MIKQKNIVIFLTLFCSLLITNVVVYAETIDRIVAVVEDDVILEGELEREVSTIKARMTESKAQLPPETVLRKQVLEKMIIDKHIFTGNANNKNLLRILPPLTINTKGIDTFIIALKEALQEIQS